MVIAVVALIVIGPERLPRVARTLGHLFGRLQRYVNDVKADINREIELEELRKFRSTVEDAARGFQSTVQGEVAKTENQLNTMTRIEEPVASASPAPADPAPAQSAQAQGEAGQGSQGTPSPPEKTAA